MPNTRSSAKHVRSDTRKREANLAVRSELRTLSKKLRSLAEHDRGKAAEFARLVVAKYDKAASNGKIPRRRADRKKGRVHALLHKLGLKP